MPGRHPVGLKIIFFLFFGMGRDLRPIENDSRPFGELLDRLGESETFNFHQETEEVPPFMATETMKDLFVFADDERGSIFLMKGTQTFPVASCLFQRGVIRDEFNQLDSVFNFTEDRFVEQI